jgi:hypothetical protein
MKKLLLLAISVIIIGCTFKDECNPIRYKGCVVIGKRTPINGPELKLKLTPHLADSIGYDYIWIKVPSWESERLNIGETIK